MNQIRNMATDRPSSPAPPAAEVPLQPAPPRQPCTAPQLVQRVNLAASSLFTHPVWREVLTYFSAPDDAPHIYLLVQRTLAAEKTVDELRQGMAYLLAQLVHEKFPDMFPTVHEVLQRHTDNHPTPIDAQLAQAESQHTVLTLLSRQVFIDITGHTPAPTPEATPRCTFITVATFAPEWAATFTPPAESEVRVQSFCFPDTYADQLAESAPKEKRVCVE